MADAIAITDVSLLQLNATATVVVVIAAPAIITTVK